MLRSRAAACILFSVRSQAPVDPEATCRFHSIFSHTCVAPRMVAVAGSDEGTEKRATRTYRYLVKPGGKEPVLLTRLPFGQTRVAALGVRGWLEATSHREVSQLVQRQVTLSYVICAPKRMDGPPFECHRSPFRSRGAVVGPLASTISHGVALNDVDTALAAWCGGSGCSTRGRALADSPRWSVQTLLQEQRALCAALVQRGSLGVSGGRHEGSGCSELWRCRWSRKRTAEFLMHVRTMHNEVGVCTMYLERLSVSCLQSPRSCTRGCPREADLWVFEQASFCLGSHNLPLFVPEFFEGHKASLGMLRCPIGLCNSWCCCLAEPLVKLAGDGSGEGEVVHRGVGIHVVVG